MKTKHIVIIALLCLAIGIVCGIVIGRRMEPCRSDNHANVRYEELVGLRDTSYYTDNNSEEYRYSPKRVGRGVIPNAETAAIIAYDYVNAVYGESFAKGEQPYKVQLINEEAWVVDGQLPPNYDGGTFHLAMERYTGKIWYIYHEK